MNIFLSCFGLRLCSWLLEAMTFPLWSLPVLLFCIYYRGFRFKKTDQFILNSCKYCKNKFQDMTIFKFIVQIYDFLNPDFLKIQNNDLFQS